MTSKKNFYNRGRSVIGIVIVLIIVGLTCVGVYYYFIKQNDKTSGVIDIQKCSEGTLYDQCSINKPTYCDSGNLTNKCSICSCPSGQQCQANGNCLSEKPDCEYQNYKMAFVLLVRNPNDATQNRLNKLFWIKSEFSKNFSDATKNIASMDTSDETAVIVASDDIVKNWEAIVFDPVEKTERMKKIVKNFYETNNDKYDFISIYPAFPTPGAQNHFYVVNNIKGIGEPIFDISSEYGSGGKLKGVNFFQQIDDIALDDTVINALLHETGHQWCCFVGDIFARGENGARLEIKDENRHFYSGLQFPYEGVSPMGSYSWIPNGDGTYKISAGINININLKYHPFQLYFMGLLPREEYNTKYQIYDAGLYGEQTNVAGKAIPYKQISIDDIINVEGERNCIE